jgi:hypothetical protein
MLLDHMRAPPRNPADRKDRREQINVDPKGGMGAR